MSYWTHWHNIRYELVEKRIKTHLCLWVASHLPRQVRMWVVVSATNEARRLYPHPSGYAGPDGLSYSEIYDGAKGRRLSVPDVR